MAKPLIRTPDGSHLPTVRERRRTRHRKRLAYELVQRLAARNLSVPCTAALLDLTNEAVRQLRRLGRPRQLHEPVQAMRELAQLDPQLLREVHLFRRTRDLQHAGTSFGEHHELMLACAACVAAAQRANESQRAANRQRWKHLTQSKPRVSPASSRR